MDNKVYQSSHLSIIPLLVEKVMVLPGSFPTTRRGDGRFEDRSEAEVVVGVETIRRMLEAGGAAADGAWVGNAWEEGGWVGPESWEMVFNKASSPSKYHDLN